jgi:hypothetical protein
MAEFFPRRRIAWHLEEPSALRRWTLALVPFALLTGLVLRGYRWMVLAVLQPDRPLLLVVAVVAGIAMLGALAAGHLANYPLRSWKWRAPLFGALVAVGESVASLVLTAVGQERSGRAIATWADWFPMTLTILLTRVLVVALFALVLAVVVHLVQRGLDQPST